MINKLILNKHLSITYGLFIFFQLEKIFLYDQFANLNSIFFVSSQTRSGLQPEEPDRFVAL